MPIVTEIPEGMIPHTDDSSKYGYPAGVEHTTKVRVIIRCAGQNILYEKEAQSFGWNIEPAMPSCPGLEPCSAPITHYQKI